MLKRLELLGFKSFADKTVFEFGSGITCIVGPNGSGKSNVVDAIKWVLGEQSAKSLRGKEMADVIFNGSSTRRSVGFAEATLVFDNARRLLPVDADTVQLTRRVYRSGEGEYLINKNPSRLRDFRELFMGTGAGADAYCVIEQGKVDVLLQSSTKDRRIIFEEAAGISRFKARKIECLRKLEHVDQNLLRLKDIVDEVEKQLRSVKLQAAKARRHQEYSCRLRELRLQSGLVDFHEFSLRLRDIEQTVTQLGEEVTKQSSHCNNVDAKLLQVQSLAEELENQIRSLESEQADGRQEIASLEKDIGYERAHSKDLRVQIKRLRSQWLGLSTQVAELERHVVTTRAEVERVEQLCDARRTEVDAEGAAVDELRADAEREQQRIDEAQGRSLDLVQAANQLHNELAALESHEKTLRVQRKRLADRCAALAAPIAELVAQVESLVNQERSAAQDRQEIRQSLENADDQLETAWISEQQTSAQLAQMREERSAVAARVELLTDLERRQDGIDGGIQQVLASNELAANRLGLVADLVQVDVANAAMIERALGERAAMVVVRRRQDLIDWLAQPENSPAGLVRFLALDHLAPVRPLAAESPSLADDPGFIGLAAHLVQPAPGMQDLVAHLLGQTVLVRDLGAALRMSAGAAPGTRFVAATGQVLESDYSITAGQATDVGGIVSRKSQLRALEEQTSALDERIDQGEQELVESHRMLTQVKQDRAILDDRLRTTADQAAQLGNLLGQRRQQVAGLNEESDLHRAELVGIDRELSGIGDHRALLQARTVHNAQERDAVQESLHTFETRLGHMLREIEDRQESLTKNRVELGRTEGHLTGLSQRLAVVTTDLDKGKAAVTKTWQEADAAMESDLACQRKVLAASSALAEQYVRKERIGREIAVVAERREQMRQQRHALGAESLSARESLQGLQSDLHKHQLDASEAKHQRATLEERIREDYEVELSSMYSPETPPDAAFDRGATQQEIQELRRKIGSLGNVNLEALAELQELETRSTTLQAQINDLNTSKATLDEIIRKINQDSQRLFMETLDAVRSHFGELFRTLFGGGRADILLENEVDVLESGIEIVARPPGKELRSLSLLSGGEKTLTTVALLMAVFRAKPSPFCILDEVDAALDEANIERYTNMLQQFSGQAQFIMITHSKKSMVCADVLYGITMQESGISKRVSVRFEDVGEQGEISRDALERNETTEELPATNPKEQEAA